MNESLILDASLLCNMAIGRQIKDSDAQIIGIEFSDDGFTLAAYTADTIHLYDMTIGKKMKTLKNNVNKIAKLRFTHAPTSVVYVSQGETQDLFVWSIYENEIIKSFKGPVNSQVVCFVTDPVTDVVLLTDRSNKLTFYDLASDGSEPTIVTSMNYEPETLVATFDHMGNGFYVGTNYVTNGQRTSEILYFKNGDVAPKQTAMLKLQTAVRIVALKADFHGRTLAALTEKNALMVIHSDLKKVLFEIRQPPLQSTVYPEFSYSVDSKFLLNGDEDGTVKIYDIEKGCEIARYSNHATACLCVKFSPAHVLFASACKNLILWIPKFWDRT